VKRKPKVQKKVLKNLKLKLKELSDRKVAPMLLAPSNGSSCTY
jgi:hypothetical protein